jgi:poly-gamma-glutamate capsule biosynthesis protein CapA/YwtB (metallophosphatase superfamily)
VAVKPLFRALIAVALVAAAPAQIGCGGSDEQEQVQEAIRDVEIRSLAAYECMPGNLRRELRELERKHNVRLRTLARKSLPKGTPAGTTPPGDFRQIVEADARRRQILAQARAIYRRYSPGGRDYDATCYAREKEKAKAVIDQGATGAAGTTP